MCMPVRDWEVCTYDASDDPPLTVGEAPKNHHLWDTLNKVTQSGNQEDGSHG